MTDTFKSRVQAMKDVWNTIPDGVKILMTGGALPIIKAIVNSGGDDLKSLYRARDTATKYGGDTTDLDRRIALLEASQRHQQSSVDPWQMEKGFDAPIRARTAENLTTDAQKRELYTQQLALEQQYLDQIYQLRSVANQREVAQLEAQHNATIVGDETYYAKKLQLGEQAEREEIARLQGQLALQKQIQANAQGELGDALKSEDSERIAAAQAKVEEAKARVVTLTSQEQAAETKLGQTAKDVALARYQADVAHINRMVSIERDEEDYVKGLKDQTEQLQFENDLIGKSEEAQATANVERKLTNDFLAKKRDLTREIADLEFNKPSGYEDEAARKRTEIERLDDATQKTIADQKRLIAVGAEARNTVSGWNSVADAIGRIATRVSSVRDELKRLLQDLIAVTLKRWVLSIGASLTSGATSSALANQAASTGQGTLSGAGSSLLGTGLTAANEYGGGLIGASTFTGGVSASVFGTGALTGAGDFVGTGLAGFAGNMALAAGATDAFAATVAAAVPVIGWIVAIGILLYSIFGNKGGGPKAGGSFLGAFTGTGVLTGDLTSTVDRSHYLHDEKGQDAAARQVGESLGQTFARTLAGLGGSSRARNWASAGIAILPAPRPAWWRASCATRRATSSTRTTIATWAGATRSSPRRCSSRDSA
jgi:hypothetical protein